MDKKKIIITAIFTIVFSFAVFIVTAELRFVDETQNTSKLNEADSEFLNLLQLAEDFFREEGNDSASSGQSSASGGRRPSSKPSARPVQPVQNGQAGNRPNSGKKPSASGQKPSALGQNVQPGQPSAPGNNSASDKNPGAPGGNIGLNTDLTSRVWGEIKMFLEVFEGKSKSIKLDIINEEDSINVKAIPMTKVTALRELKPYRFTLKNSGTVNLDANLSLDVIGNTLGVNPENVRVYIEDMYGNVIIDSTFSNSQILLEKDIRISRNMDRKFKLWAWVDSRVDSDIGDFRFKISAFGTEVKEVD